MSEMICLVCGLAHRSQCPPCINPDDPDHVARVGEGLDGWVLSWSPPGLNRRWYLSAYRHSPDGTGWNSTLVFALRFVRRELAEACMRRHPNLTGMTVLHVKRGPCSEGGAQ